MSVDFFLGKSPTAQPPIFSRKGAKVGSTDIPCGRGENFMSTKFLCKFALL